MSVYTCEQCSFYSDKHIKHVKHLASQKHRENTERILGKPPSTRAGQSIAAHRLLRAPQENKETDSENVKQTKVTQAPNIVTYGFPSVFTLLEVNNNCIVGARRIDMNNSVIRFVDE